MVKFTKTNPNMKVIVASLKEKSYTEDAAIWKDIAKRLGKTNKKICRSQHIRYKQTLIP